MRRPVDNLDKFPRFNGLAIFWAFVFHLLAVSLVWSAAPAAIESQARSDISIVLVEAALPLKPDPTMIEPAPKPVEPPKPKPKPQPTIEPAPEPIVPPEPTPIPEPVTPTFPDATLAPPTVIQQNSIAGGGEASFPDNPLKAEPYIPSRWALKPPLAPKRLEGLGFSREDIACLTSLKAECQDLRKDVFEEYRLTETELVWTPNRPDTGMPAEFRGLSENEILEKLGMNHAGGNGLMILPGISIDGPLWDKLHGVNKTCKLRQNYGNVSDGSAGTLKPQRICD